MTHQSPRRAPAHHNGTGAAEGMHPDSGAGTDDPGGEATPAPKAPAPARERPRHRPSSAPEAPGPDVSAPSVSDILGAGRGPGRAGPRPGRRPGPVPSVAAGRRHGRRTRVRGGPPSGLRVPRSAEFAQRRYGGGRSHTLIARSRTLVSRRVRSGGGERRRCVAVPVDPGPGLGRSCGFR
ncbi:hypothetical protein GCM10009787_16040 [Streptomyces bangladeshensis]|uniref:Uncharacterized protein n=1 Tax=Streptomyces bangladeshensis TaxID=295352 RepID=A0ABP5NA53_9ACTN